MLRGVPKFDVRRRVYGQSRMRHARAAGRQVRDADIGLPSSHNLSRTYRGDRRHFIALHPASYGHDCVSEPICMVIVVSSIYELVCNWAGRKRYMPG